MIALDASALLAMLLREPGHQRVAALMPDACMSSVNFCEVLSRFARAGAAQPPFAAPAPAGRLAAGLRSAATGAHSARGDSKLPRQDIAPLAERLLATPLEIVPFSAEQAAIAAALMPLVVPLGLSLGDRACLALARQRGLRAVTADRAWRRLPAAFEIEMLR